MGRTTGPPGIDSPIRASRGAEGEAGGLVGKIDKGHPVRDFHGYSDNTSTSKKIMKDVFARGDLYFRWVVHTTRYI